MEEERSRTRFRSFVLGGLVGASAALATARRRRPGRTRQTPIGLAAFEDAPCYHEIVEQERAAAGEAPSTSGRR
jgi:hypothetical protein